MRSTSKVNSSRLISIVFLISSFMYSGIPLSKYTVYFTKLGLETLGSAFPFLSFISTLLSSSVLSQGNRVFIYADHVLICFIDATITIAVVSFLLCLLNLFVRPFVRTWVCEWVRVLVCDNYDDAIKSSKRGGREREREKEHTPRKRSVTTSERLTILCPPPEPGPVSTLCCSSASSPSVLWRTLRSFTPRTWDDIVCCETNAQERWTRKEKVPIDQISFYFFPSFLPLSLSVCLLLSPFLDSFHECVALFFVLPSTYFCPLSGSTYLIDRLAGFSS